MNNSGDNYNGKVKQSSILQKLNDKNKLNSKLTLFEKYEMKKAAKFRKKKAKLSNVSSDDDDEYKPEDLRNIKIITFRKNEHFGDVLMFLNHPSPIRVRVKSKISDLFLLRKLDYANLAKEFPEIIRKAYFKSVHNFERIQSIIAKAKAIYLQNHAEQSLQKLQLMIADSNINKTMSAPYKSDIPSLQPIKEDEENEIDESSRNSEKISIRNGNIGSMPSDGNSSMRYSTKKTVLSIDNEKSLNSELLFPFLNNIPQMLPQDFYDQFYNYKKNTYCPTINEENASDKFEFDSSSYRRDERTERYSRKVPNGARLSLMAEENNLQRPNITIIMDIDYPASFMIESDKKINYSRECTNEQHFCHACKGNLDRSIEQPNHIMPKKLSDNHENANLDHRSYIRKRTEKFVFGVVPALTIGAQFVEPDNESIENNSDSESSDISNIENADKAEIKVRQMRLCDEVQKNIANSNMNIINPETFYKKWLFDIHTRKLEKNQKDFLQNENEKVLKKLENYESLLSKKNLT
jgi:hypothetical protein